MVLRKCLVTGQFSFSLFFIGHHMGSKLKGTELAYLSDRTRLCRPCIAAIASLVRLVKRRD